MEVKLIILLGCLLSVGVVFGHRNHGSHGSYGGWNQHGGGGHHGHHGHHRHHRGHGCPHVNFEVKVPEGLEVSAIQKNPNVTMFGIELYVNREPAEGSQCDVCQNTTTVTYGKFIIEDTQVVIKNGDVLSYIVLTGEGSNVTRHRMKKMWVTGKGFVGGNADRTLKFRFQIPSSTSATAKEPPTTQTLICVSRAEALRFHRVQLPRIQPILVLVSKKSPKPTRTSCFPTRTSRSSAISTR